MNSQGLTALHLAIKLQKPAVVKQLVELGASLYTKTASGDSALKVALRKQNTFVIDFVSLQLKRRSSIKPQTQAHRPVMSALSVPPVLQKSNSALIL